MGKPKFVSSIKAMQEALVNLRATGPKSMTWVCVQQAKTHSFREVCNSFNSLYSLASSEEAEDPAVVGGKGQDGGDMISIRLSEGESSSSSSLASTSLWTESYDSSRTELVSKGCISSKRFFFSPCTTKSIMEEVSLQEVVKQTAFSGVEDEGRAEEILDIIGGEGSYRRLRMWDEEEEMKKSMLRRKSVMIAVASENPYEDFRDSMEDMVEANGIKDWSGLYELLHCYLSLNDKSNHETILLAFVDLLIKLVACQEIEIKIGSKTLMAEE